MPTQGATDGGSRLRAVLLCSLAVFALSVAAPATAAASTPTLTPADDPHSLGGGPRAQTAPDDGTPTAGAPANNTTVHENPRRVEEDGDSGELRSYLARSMARRLERSAVRLDQSQYRRAKDLLGSGYSDSLGKYVDVVGETESADSKSARAFERARDRQRRFVDATREFRRTYEEYQRARENGNTERARRLARELAEQRRNVTRSGDALLRSLDRVGNRTGSNVSRARRSVSAIRQNVSARGTDVARTEFVTTTLAASPEREWTSFDDPARITGVLRTANGTPVADREVTVEVGNRTYETNTDANGSFAVAYRPTTVRAAATNVTVTYVPDDESRYLRSNATVSLDVRPVDGMLRITDAPNETAYDRPVDAAGRLTVDGEPVAGMPVAVTLGNASLGTVRTGPNGEFSVEKRLPASVPPGNRALRVRPAVDDAAVRAAAASRSVRVVPTATALSVDATATDGRTVEASGRLTTADGAPIPNRSVVVRAGDTRKTVRTGADGSFRARLRVPESARGSNETVAVIATHPGRGSSLERSKARATATLQSADAATGQSDRVTVDVTWRTVYVGVGTLLLTLLGAVLVLRDGAAPDDTASNESGGADDADPGPSAGTLLSAARERLRRGDTDGAVRTAYAAVRRWGEDSLGVGTVGTHWEFYRAGRERAPAAERESLRDLTQVYERAAFDLRRIDEAEASDAVDAARRLVESDDGD